MYQRVLQQLARTTNSVEGWHNAFQTSIACSHPTIGKFLKALQREQSLQEAFVTKWEAGETRVHTKKTVERNERIRALVSDYENRETLIYLRVLLKTSTFEDSNHYSNLFIINYLISFSNYAISI